MRDVELIIGAMTASASNLDPHAFAPQRSSHVDDFVPARHQAYRLGVDEELLMVKRRGEGIARDRTRVLQQ